MGDFINFLGNNLADFWTYTGFANATVGHVVMILVGLGFIYLAVAKEFEPMLLIPIGFGMLIGNIPFNMDAGLKVGIYEEGSVLNILYQGVTSGWYPPLIFLGIGAMTDFSALISNPKLMLIGAAAQFGIFGAYMIALEMGFDPMQAGAIGIIGGADGPTAIFLSSKLAPNLMGAIAVSAYSYMALVPVIQPPIMRLLTTKNERVIRMKPPRAVSHTEKVIFPIIGLLLTCFLVPSGLPLLGMLFFGNLLKESGVTRRLANTASGPLIDTITILLGLTVGASTQASEFLTLDSIKIFALGALSFVIATASGVIFVKIFNIFHQNNVPHSLSNIPCEFHLMIIHMLIKFALSRNHNWHLSNLKRHNKTGRASMCDDNSCILNILYHLLIRNELTPLTIFRFICTEACLHNYIFMNYAIFF